MLNRHRLYLIGTLGSVLMLLMLSSGCMPLSGGPIEGQVINHATGKPITDAFVVATWRGTHHAILFGQSTCYHAELVRSDSEGKYRIPRWSGKRYDGVIIDKRWHIKAYKRGYQYILSENPEYQNKTLRLSKVDDEVDVWKLDLLGITQELTCSLPEPSGKLEPRYASALQMLREEAHNIPSHLLSNKGLRSLLYHIDRLEFGSARAKEIRSEIENK